MANNVAYLFHLNTVIFDIENYHADQKFQAPFPQYEDLFGNSVAIDASGNFIIGAPGMRSNNIDFAGGLLFGRAGN